VKKFKAKTDVVKNTNYHMLIKFASISQSWNKNNNLTLWNIAFIYFWTSLTQTLRDWQNVFKLLSVRVTDLLLQRQINSWTVRNQSLFNKELTTILKGIKKIYMTVQTIQVW